MLRTHFSHAKRSGRERINCAFEALTVVFPIFGAKADVPDSLTGATFGQRPRHPKGGLFTQSEYVRFFVVCLQFTRSAFAEGAGARPLKAHAIDRQIRPNSFVHAQPDNGTARRDCAAAGKLLRLRNMIAKRD